MSKWRNSFPVRASRRLFENHGKVCPDCGQNDPLLLGENGLCANCNSRAPEENHHILGKAFRNSKEAQQAVIAVSPNAHRLLSDMQAGNANPPTADPDSWLFFEASYFDLVLSLSEIWMVFEYLQYKLEMIRDIPLIVGILLLLWFLTQIDKLDLTHFVDRAKMNLFTNRS